MQILTEQELAALSEQAAAGNSAAAYTLGMKFLSGEADGKPNMKLAELYLKKAADAKIPEACLEYGWFCINTAGKLTRKVINKAVGYLSEAAEQGNLTAAARLARIYSSQHLPSFNPAEAFKYAKQSSDGGNAEGLFNLGDLTAKGIGTEKNQEAGFEMIKKAADQGLAIAQLSVAVEYLQQAEVTERDENHDREALRQKYAETLDLLKKAGEGGETAAYYYAALICHKGLAGEKDNVQAAHFAKLAAEGGIAPAVNLHKRLEKLNAS